MGQFIFQRFLNIFQRFLFLPNIFQRFLTKINGFCLILRQNRLKSVVFRLNWAKFTDICEISGHFGRFLEEFVRNPMTCVTHALELGTNPGLTSGLCGISRANDPRVGPKPRLSRGIWAK